MKDLIVTTCTNIGSGNNIFEYKLPSQQTFNNAEIRLVEASMRYSWKNITAAYNNNVIAYRWINGTIVTITLPDSFLTIEEINLALVAEMTTQTHYLLNADGDGVFYIAIANNIPRYAVQVVCSPLPTALGTLTYPAGNTWTLPATTLVPSLRILANSFTDIIGYVAGDYPSSAILTTSQSFLSTYTPNVTPVSTVGLTCNIISGYGTSTQQTSGIFSAADVSSFGGFIVKTFDSDLWAELQNTSTDRIEFRLVDQLNRPVQILDLNGILFRFVIRSPSDYGRG